MFRFPHDVDGWLTEIEGRALAEAATGKRVLELGSYKGRSTICLAQTAEHVTAVDTFDGRATPKTGETLGDFLTNLSRYAVRWKTSFYVGTSQHVVPTLDATYDLAFIDGAHAFDSIRSDCLLAMTKLRQGGLLCFHDYNSPVDPGVTFAVNRLVAAGAELVRVAGTVAMLTVEKVRVAEFAASERLLVVAMPNRTGEGVGKAYEAFLRASKRGLTRIELRQGHSLLPFCFNRIWCDALNYKRACPVTHFAMIHDDVCPEPGWLDVLLDELDATGADMVSAVAPIKNGYGLTSTAVDVGGNPWVPRRLSMTEVFDLPETFGVDDVPWREPDSRLLVNTGLWVCRFDGGWPEQVCFRQQDRIERQPNGDYVARTIPEDWDFSRQLQSHGLKVVATRKVGLYHGRQEFHNRGPWGAWTTDEAFQKCLKDRGAVTAAEPVGV